MSLRTLGRWIGMLTLLGVAGGGLCAPRAVAQDALAESLDQLSLATRVQLSLSNDTLLRPYDFVIAAEGDQVTIHGRVPTQEDWARITAIVERIRGVGTVVNNVQLGQGQIPLHEEINALVVVDAADVEALDPMMVLEMETTAQAEETLSEPEVIYKVPEGYHLVREGESLYDISQQYEIAIRDLRRMNDLSVGDLPEPGQLLRIQAENREN